MKKTILDYSSPQSPECEAAAITKLNEFKNQYRASTSADWQTFVIAFRMGWDRDEVEVSTEIEKVQH